MSSKNIPGDKVCCELATFPSIFGRKGHIFLFLNSLLSLECDERLQRLHDQFIKYSRLQVLVMFASIFNFWTVSLYLGFNNILTRNILRNWPTLLAFDNGSYLFSYKNLIRILINNNIGFYPENYEVSIYFNVVYPPAKILFVGT